MKRSYAQFLLDALVYFELYPQAKEYRDVSRVGVLAFLLKTIQNVPGYEGTEEINIKEAKEILRKIASGEISATVPEKLEEIMEDWEKHAEEKRAGKITPEETHKWKDQFGEKLKAITEEGPPPVPKPEIKVEKPLPTGVPTGLKIAISPASTKGIASFVAKALFAPANFVIKSGGWRNRTAGTAAALSLSFGIRSSALKAAIERKPGLSSDSLKRLGKLVELMKNIETGSPVIAALARRAYGIGNFQLIFDVQELGIPQAQFYNLIPTGNTVAFPQTFFAPKEIFSAVGRRLFSKTSSKVLNQIAGKKVVAATVTKVAGKKVLGTAIGAAIGNIPGAIIGWISSEIITKVGSWLKRHKEVVVGAVGGIAGLFVAGIPGLIIGGTIAFGAATVVTQGVQAATAQIGGAIQTGLIGITSLVLPAIGAPIVVALISIPIIVAIILFIINSGAYIVPPKAPEFTGIVESPYIGVEKEASPDCLKRSGCPGLPGTVTYKIKITAKKGTLTNIQFENKYQVLGEGNESDLPEIPKLDVPLTISPVEPYTVTYSLSFGTNLDNSIVLDTLTITADAPEQKGAVASDVATVIIGQPPASQCPILGGGITTGSYNGNSEIGHGSNPYWSGPAGTDCGYAIPAFSGCMGPTAEVDPDRDNVCRNQSPLCNHYGYAADAGGAGGTPVFLPAIFGETLNWTFKRRLTIANTSWGWGYLFTAGKYQLYLGHLNQTTPPSTAPSGTVIGTLYPGLSNPHVHIELQINGQWVRPDFLCGGPGP